MTFWFWLLSWIAVHVAPYVLLGAVAYRAGVRSAKRKQEARNER